MFQKKRQQQQVLNRHRTSKHAEHLQNTEHTSRPIKIKFVHKDREAFFDLCLKTSGTQGLDIQF